MFNIDYVVVTPEQGTYLPQVLEGVLNLAKSLGTTVLLPWNGLIIRVTPDSTFDEVWKKWVEDCEKAVEWYQKTKYRGWLEFVGDDPRIPLIPRAVEDYLDFAIRKWREKAKLATEEEKEKARHYIDAFQSARVSFFGVPLPKEEEMKVEGTITGSTRIKEE